MLSLAPRIRRPIRSIAGDRSGLALVEFGMSLPVVLILGLAGLETANYALAHLRVSNMAAMTADGAARVRDSIDEADVSDLFTGTIMTGRPIDFEANGRIILSDLEPSPDGTRQWIRWQRCAGAKTAFASSHGRPLTDGGAVITDATEIFGSDRTTASTSPSSHTSSTMTGVTSGDSEIAAQAGTAVMVAEVVYTYQPLVAGATLDGREIRYRSAFNVRQRVDQSIRNAGRMDPLSCG